MATMLNLNAKIREGKRRGDQLPAVLYGPEIENLSISTNIKDFKKVFAKVGESSLISLEVEGKKGKFSVLVHGVDYDPVSSEPIHVDFYQPVLTKEVEVQVPLIFEGDAPAVKELGGTLVKDVKDLKVKALPTALPHEIKVNITSLKTFEDKISVKDLEIPLGVTVLRRLDEVVATVVPPAKVEEELATPIEEKVEEVGKVEKKEKVKEEIAEEAPKEPTKTPETKEK